MMTQVILLIFCLFVSATAYCDNDGHSVGDAFFMDNHAQCRPCSHSEDSGTTTREDIAYPAYKRIGHYATLYANGEGDSEYHMYNGVGSTGPTNTYPDGTQLEEASEGKRVNECAKACRNFVSPAGKNAKGFLVHPNGRCFCSAFLADYGTPINNDYTGYDFVNTDKGDLDSAYHAVKPHLQQEAGTCNMPRYKLKASGNVCVGKPSYTHKGGGICMALGVRVFAGSSDNPGTNAESYTLWCARACSYREPPDGYGPWSNQGDAVGFSVYEPSGRCYCNHKKYASCTADLAHTSYKYYDYNVESPQKHISVGYDATKAPELCAKRCRSEGYTGFSIDRLTYAPALGCKCVSDGCNEIRANSGFDAYTIEPDFFAMHTVDTSKANYVEECATKCTHSTAGSTYIGDGYCAPDVSKNTNTYFPYCEAACRNDPECDAFSYINKDDHSEISASQCILSVDASCQTTADNSNSYPWKTFKLNRYGKTAKSFSVRKSDGQCLCKDYSWEECQSKGNTDEGIYSLRFSGSCPRYITTTEECEAAARYLNLPEQKTGSPGYPTINNAGLEYGCILQHPTTSRLELYLNKPSGVTNNCAHSGYGCICAETDTSSSLQIDSYDIVPDIKLPLLHRHCEDCTSAYKDLYYVRRTPFSKSNDADMIMNTFGLARDNVLHLDFEIYSDKTTAEDAAVKVLRALPTKEVVATYRSGLKKECEGDCNTDGDCEGDLICFQKTSDASAPTPVPGCTGDASHVNHATGTSMDVCIKPYLHNVQTDLDCAVGEVCYDVVGKVIDNAGATLDAAGHPMRLDANSLVFGSFSGTWLKMIRTNLLGVMQENRYTNEATSMEAMSVAKWNAVASRSLTNMAGQTTCVSARYCLLDFRHLKYELPWVNLGGTPPRKMGRCEGDCDSHDDCEGHLVCHQRYGSTEKTPGCSGGSMASGYDVCMDPVIPVQLTRPEREQMQWSKVFDGECTSGSEYNMYKGCGSSSGRTNTYPDGSDVCDATAEKGIDECAKACLDYYPTLPGFVISDQGRCFCETAESAHCSNTRGTTSYDRYDFNTLGFPGMGISTSECPVGKICPLISGRMTPEGGAFTNPVGNRMHPMRVSHGEFVFGEVDRSNFKMVSVTLDLELLKSKYISSSTVPRLSALTAAQWISAGLQGGGGTCGSSQYCAGDFKSHKSSSAISGSGQDVSWGTISASSLTSVCPIGTVCAKVTGKHNAYQMRPIGEGYELSRGEDASMGRILVFGGNDYSSAHGNCNAMSGTAKSDCHVKTCAEYCFEGKYGPQGANPSYSDSYYTGLGSGPGRGVFKGFFIKDTDGRCFCLDFHSQEASEQFNKNQKPVIDHGGSPSSANLPLAECEGDCDSDAHCQGELVCFQKSSTFPPPPGCAPNNYAAGHDFCIRPDAFWHRITAGSYSTYDLSGYEVKKTHPYVLDANILVFGKYVPYGFKREKGYCSNQGTSALVPFDTCQQECEERSDCTGFVYLHETRQLCAIMTTTCSLVTNNLNWVHHKKSGGQPARFMMVATDMDGNQIETRYTTSIRRIEDMTSAIWNSASGTRGTQTGKTCDADQVWPNNNCVTDVSLNIDVNVDHCPTTEIQEMSDWLTPTVSGNTFTVTPERDYFLFFSGSCAIEGLMYQSLTRLQLPMPQRRL